MKQILKFIATYFETYATTRGYALNTWLEAKNPQNHSELDNAIREFNELRFWY